MANFKCKKCKKDFVTQARLDSHNKRKTPCAPPKKEPKKEKAVKKEPAKKEKVTKKEPVKKVPAKKVAKKQEDSDDEYSDSNSNSSEYPEYVRSPKELNDFKLERIGKYTIQCPECYIYLSSQKDLDFHTGECSMNPEVRFAEYMNKDDSDDESEVNPHNTKTVPAKKVPKSSSKKILAQKTMTMEEMQDLIRKQNNTIKKLKKNIDIVVGIQNEEMKYISGRIYQAEKFMALYIMKAEGAKEQKSRV